MDTISVVIPVYNEEKYIEKLIESIKKQEYDFSKVEVLFVDGDSTDNTISLINQSFEKSEINYKILKNDEKITPKSVNIGIKNAKNDIIIRLDAHSEYPKEYFSKCVYYLNKTGADNVGCLTKTKSEGIIGDAIAEVLSSKFGVGNSKFRTNAESGYVDTVPFGTFRKELFDKIGYFNEELLRSEDNEINYRIRKNGGKVYLFNDITTTYHPRDTICKISRQAFENGKWSVYTSYFIPGSMGIRHLIPLMFVLSIIAGIIVCIFDFSILKILFILEIIMYLVLDIIFSLKDIFQNKILKSILKLFIYPMYHISYGIGSILGIGMIIKKKRKIRKSGRK